MRVLLLLSFCLALAAVEMPRDGAAAAALAERGRNELRAAQDEPLRAVDAALALAAALEWYRAAGDAEAIRALQADLFWCRKRMDIDTIAAWRAALAALERDPAARVERQVEATVALVVAPIEAADWFAQAEAFAADHADDPFRVAVRWFEVAQRFAGTAQGVEAQRRSLAAQLAAMHNDFRTD